MAYVDTPIPTDDLDVSQPQMRGNFSQADASFGLNHYAFSDLTANNGKHKFIQFPNQSADPATSGNEITVYSKASAGIPALFVRQESSGAIYKFTGPTPVNAATGFTYLPGNLLMQWGTFTNTTGSNAIAFTPNFTGAPFYVNAVSLSGNTSITSFFHATAQSAAGSTIQLLKVGGGLDTAGQVCQWVAIGSQ